MLIWVVSSNRLSSLPSTEVAFVGVAELLSTTPSITARSTNKQIKEESKKNLKTEVSETNH